MIGKGLGGVALAQQTRGTFSRELCRPLTRYGSLSALLFTGRASASRSGFVAARRCSACESAYHSPTQSNVSVYHDGAASESAA
jgi:hypothetical protein